jgi:hypothetical protein
MEHPWSNRELRWKGYCQPFPTYHPNQARRVRGGGGLERRGRKEERREREKGRKGEGLEKTKGEEETKERLGERLKGEKG